MQAHPRLHTGVQRDDKDVPVVDDDRCVMTTGLGFDPEPLDREPVVTQPETGKEPEVLRVTDSEPVPVTGQRSAPGPLQSHQSEVGDAPSHWVDEAPLPT